MTDPALLYAAVHDGTVGDLAFYRRICTGARSVLELGCGYGRVLGALVDRVPRLVGLDLDEDLLALATGALDGTHAELVCGDMRNFTSDARFDRILIPHSGLFCLLDDDAVHACLRCAWQSLAPGGLLVFDVYAADDFHRESAIEDLDPEALLPVKSVLVDGRRIDVLERSHWSPETQRIDATYVHVPRDGGPPVEATIPQRYLLRDQIVAALAAADLEVSQVRDGFEEPDETLVVVARRNGDTS